MAVTPQRGDQSWLPHGQLVIGERSPEYQALRSACLAGAGTTTPRIDHPCPGREWGLRYHAWRSNLHRWAAIDLGLLAPTFPKGEGPSTWAQRRSRSCPARLDNPTSGRGASLLSCGDVEANPDPPATDWGGGGLRGSPGTGGGGVRPPRHLPCQGCLCDAGEPPLPVVLDEGGRRVRPAEGYATSGPLLTKTPFNCLEEVVAKEAREGSLMLIISPEWPGPQYPWWTTLCALCPRRWQLPQDRPLYLRGGMDLIPSPRWRAWAFLLDSREGSQARMPTSAPPILPQTLAPRSQRHPGQRTRMHNS